MTKQRDIRKLMQAVGGKLELWLGSILARKPRQFNESQLVFLQLIAKPHYSVQTTPREVIVDRFPGLFGWGENGKVVEINLHQLKERLHPILDNPPFVNPRSDLTSIRVEHLIDRLCTYRSLLINRDTGEITTERDWENEAETD